MKRLRGPMACLFPDCGLHALTGTGVGQGETEDLGGTVFFLSDFTCSVYRGNAIKNTTTGLFS